MTQTNTHALVIGRGRAFIEAIEGDIAIVRFDCGTGTRSRCHRFPVKQIDFTREWAR